MQGKKKTEQLLANLIKFQEKERKEKCSKGKPQQNTSKTTENLEERCLVQGLSFTEQINPHLCFRHFSKKQSVCLWPFKSRFLRESFLLPSLNGESDFTGRCFFGLVLSFLLLLSDEGLLTVNLLPACHWDSCCLSDHFICCLWSEKKVPPEAKIPFRVHLHLQFLRLYLLVTSTCSSSSLNQEAS